MSIGWLVGLNFNYYSTVSQRAEEAAVRGLDRKLITDYLNDWKGPLKKFAAFKVNPTQGIVRRNIEWLVIVGYLAIGVIPFIAFLIWFVNTVPPSVVIYFRFLNS